MITILNYLKNVTIAYNKYLLVMFFLGLGIDLYLPEMKDLLFLLVIIFGTVSIIGYDINARFTLAFSAVLYVLSLITQLFRADFISEKLFSYFFSFLIIALIQKLITYEKKVY